MNNKHWCFQTAGMVRLVMILALATGLAGCRKKDASAYQAPSEGGARPVAAGGGQGPASAAGVPALDWKLPAGWVEAGGDEVSFKNFTIAGPNGTEARVSLTRLGNLLGKEALLVNMWRQQVNLAPVAEDEAAKSLQPIQFGEGAGSVFEVLGTNQNQAFEIITAFTHRPDGSWFCKISGGAALVAAQKPAFIEFLKSLKIAAAPALEAAAAPGTQFNWQVPAGWKTEAAGDMQVARFSIAADGGAKAEVFVSKFDTDTGGNLANINRWRRQIGLDAAQDKDLQQLISPLDVNTPGAIVVDMANSGKRLVGAIVPRNGSYWFYKLVGDAGAVGPAKEAYVTFAKSKP